MSIQIIEARSKKERKTFFHYPIDLYRDSPYYVPPIVADDLELFDPKRNPSFDNAEARLFLAYRDGQLVGRIGSVLNRAANAREHVKDLRFCHFDAIDDMDVASALFMAVEQWGRELGMETITGPHGFSSFDKEGMLVEGFDEMPTFVTYYNHPYYNVLVERFGFRKHFDFVEYCVENADKIEFPDRLSQLIERIEARNQFQIVHFDSKKEMFRYAKQVFDLFDEAYEDLDDFVPLNQKQKDYLLNKFYPVLHKDFVKVVLDNKGQVVGFMIALPSLSEGLRKAKGYLFPFGFIHLLWSARHSKTLDLVLAGVRKSCRNKGVDLIMAYEMFKTAKHYGILRSESNPELERNSRIQAEWKYFNPRLHKRRRIYIKEI